MNWLKCGNSRWTLGAAVAVAIGVATALSVSANKHGVNVDQSRSVPADSNADTGHVEKQ